MILARTIPPYFDYLIDGFDRGNKQRFVHLGHWDHPTACSEKLSGEEFANAQARMNDILLGHAALADNLQVLDIACGFGGTLETINHYYHGMQLIGLNLDYRQLEICQTLSDTNGNTLTWVNADAVCLPFGDQVFDRVFCVEAMFHFASRRQFLAEVARILKPGGILVASDITIQVNDPARLENYDAHAIETSIDDWYGPWPDFWGKDDDHRELATAVGLDCTYLHEASANTAPTYRFTAPRDYTAAMAADESPTRAAATLAWLHQKQIMRYWYMRFDKVGD